MNVSRRKEYYLPYDSEDEEETTDTESTSSEESYVSGPGSEQPELVIPSGIPYELEPSETKPLPEYEESRNTSLVMISSRDRDTNIYPQPTFFTLRLPRTFKNIRSITITQLNLLNSFFNFSAAKSNTTLYIHEQDRTIFDSNSGQTIPNHIQINIREGTYSASDLVTELSNALNQTPLFADITDGFGGFISQFQGTGDFSILFNLPGNVVYNSLTGAYESGITMSQLVARYFQTVQTVGTVNFTYNQCLVAYYYPIIKELTTRNQLSTFNAHLEALPAGYTDPYTYIVFSFTGLDDPYILTLALDPANIVVFDEFRYRNTFLNFLVNEYICSYNSLQGRLQISVPSLNKSIRDDLTFQYNTILNEEVLKANFESVAIFQGNYDALTLNNGALLEFYNFIHRNFTNQFGIDFGQYTAEFFANLSNEITMYNVKERFGWNTILTPTVSSNAITRSADILPNQVPTPWSNIVFPQYGFAASTFVSTYNIGQITFSNASETTYGYTDIPFGIDPTCYKRINYTSRCRQTMSIMTIPRYVSDRGPETDETYPFGPEINQTPLLYSVDQTTVPSTYTILTDITNSTDFNLYTMTQVMFTSADYMRDENRWLTYITPQILSGFRVQEGSVNFGKNPPLTDMTILAYRPHIFFQLNIDQYALEPNAKWLVDIYVETRDGSLFPVPIVVARYRDRAAFMADVAEDLKKNYAEDPRHVFERQTFTNTASAILTTTVVNNEISYFSVHIAKDSDLLSGIPLRIFALLHDEYGVYTTAVPLDYRRLPYQNQSTLLEQITPNSDIYKSPLTSIYDPSIFQLGYDINGISNNWLDYTIQGPDGTYYDPATITTYEDEAKRGLRYLFDLQTDGSQGPVATGQEWSLYFQTGSSNIIRDTYTVGSGNIYLSASIPLKAPAADNEVLCTNWLPIDGTRKEEYLSPEPMGIATPDTAITSSAGIFLACVNPDTPLRTDVSTSSTFADLSGFCGLSFFLEPNDIVKLTDIQLKFVYMQPSFDNLANPYTRANTPLGQTDTRLNVFENQETFTSVSASSSTSWDDWYTYNRRNTKIGIFKTADIVGKNIADLTLDSALLTMTLQKVTQVGSYTNVDGTLRTKEPDWGTYYFYKVNDVPDTIYSVDDVGNWNTLDIDEDITPDPYIAGETSYPGYFLTHTNINNYTFLPRSYGVSAAVGFSITNPYTLRSVYTTDIPNSYTIVPFYNDPVDGGWKVGSMYGVSYTREPCVPDPISAGKSPYIGSPGVFALTRDMTDTIILANGDQTSFHPYYWNAKIRFERLDLEYNPATDLALFGGFSNIQNEYQDTVMFLYENITPDTDLYDITQSTVTFASTLQYYKWGQESNEFYKAYDDQGGYNYLSYLHEVSVRSTNVDAYSVHVRGYVPTSKFTTGLRFIGKNYTDFGTATLSEIAQEIRDLSTYTYIDDATGYELLNNPELYSTIINTNDIARLGPTGTEKFYSHQYADALIKFDELFKYPDGITFGKKIGYKGERFVLEGYESAIVQYAGFYSSLRGTLVTYTDVLSSATGRLQEYVRDRYGNIIPESFINRNRITDPIPYALLFKSKLEPPFDTQFDEWGLGWNLGFNKVDTNYRTIHVSDTFIRITQDYIYLRLNPEMNMNTMGVSGKENLSASRDSFGQDQKYFAKILLNNFGGFCRAAVQNPKQFNPVLGKYDVGSFELVDRNGIRINNVDCEYDIVMEISESFDNGISKFAKIRGR